MTRTRVRFSCTECGAQAPKWLGRCPECGGWDTLAEETVAGRRLARPLGADRSPRPARRGRHRTPPTGARPGSRSSTGCSAAGSSAARSRSSAASRASARARSCSRRSPRMAAAGAPVAARHRRGVQGAGAPPGRAARRAAPEPADRRRDLAAARAHPRRRGRARRARGRLDPDGRGSRRPRRARLGEPGPRVRAPAGARREGPQHPDAARRSRHEGRRDRRPPHARAHRRHRARVRGGPPPRAAHAARAEAPVRLHPRARTVRDGGGRARATSRTRRPSSSPTGAPACPARWSPRSSRARGRCSSRCRRSSPRRRRRCRGGRRRASTRTGSRCCSRCSTPARGLPVADADVYTSVAGGIRVTEAGADLAVAIAVASARRGRPVAADLVAVGEIGLGGEVRQAAQTPRRLAEAARLGFRSAIVPTSVADTPGPRADPRRTPCTKRCRRPGSATRQRGPGRQTKDLARAAIVTRSSRTREPLAFGFRRDPGRARRTIRPCRQRPDRKRCSPPCGSSPRAARCGRVSTGSCRRRWARSSSSVTAPTSSRSARAGSSSTPSSRPSACRSWRRWTGR